MLLLEIGVGVGVGVELNMLFMSFSVDESDFFSNLNQEEIEFLEGDIG
jgi:hypothetical protein